MSVPRFELEVLRAFENYAWPGNVRELRNVVEGLMFMTAGETVTVVDLPSKFAASMYGSKAWRTPACHGLTRAREMS
jgi:DNA-binding NtrC family response regulator